MSNIMPLSSMRFVKLHSVVLVLCAALLTGLVGCNESSTAREEEDLVYKLSQAFQAEDIFYHHGQYMGQFKLNSTEGIYRITISKDPVFYSDTFDEPIVFFHDNIEYEARAWRAEVGHEREALHFLVYAPNIELYIMLLEEEPYDKVLSKTVSEEIMGRIKAVFSIRRQ